jgi:predicted PurR-regulated permease PerM
VRNWGSIRIGVHRLRLRSLLSELRTLLCGGAVAIDNSAVWKRNNRESGVTESGVEEPFALLKVTLPLLTLIIVTGALYPAKDVLIPLAAAVILAVILGPIAARLEQFVGRSLSAVVLLLSGVAILATMAYVTSVELVAVADQVAGYSDNIGDKLAAIEKSVPPGLRRTNIAIRNVAARVEKSNPSLGMIYLTQHQGSIAAHAIAGGAESMTFDLRSG